MTSQPHVALQFWRFQWRRVKNPKYHENYLDSDRGRSWKRNWKLSSSNKAEAWRDVIQSRNGAWGFGPLRRRCDVGVQWPPRLMSWGCCAKSCYAQVRTGSSKRYPRYLWGTKYSKVDKLHPPKDATGPRRSSVTRGLITEVGAVGANKPSGNRSRAACEPRVLRGRFFFFFGGVAGG